MFFIRKDTALMKRLKRRLGSPRASVFSEFAFLAPVMVLLLSAMIEMAAFWDTQVMAHHTAWQIGRIAAVRAYEDQKNLTTLHGLKFGETYNNGVTNVTALSIGWPFSNPVKSLGISDKLTTVGDVTALYFMSTTGIGAFGAKAQTADATALKNLFTEQGQMLSSYICDVLKEKIKEALHLNIDIPDIPYIGDWLKFLQEWVNNLINELVDALIKPISDFIGRIVDWFCELLFDIDKSAYTEQTWKRLAQRMGAAAERMKRPEYKLEYSVPDPNSTEGRHSCRVWSSSYGKTKGKAFCYPQTALNTDPRDQGWIKSANVWPPNGQKQSMVEVKLDWPFTGMWVFPVVSGLGEKGSVVTAHGRSLHYIQPAIFTEHLLSKGATAYIQGTVATKADIGSLDIGNYVKMMYFSLQYRMRNEKLSRGKWFTVRPGGSWWDPSDWASGYAYDPLWDILANESANNRDYQLTVRSQKEGVGHDRGDSSPTRYADSFVDYTSGGMWANYTAPDKWYFDSEHWMFRNYLFWMNTSTYRKRYYGPEICKDHCLGNGVVKGWGQNGKSDTMFFNHPEALAVQEKSPDSGVHAQLMRAAKYYDTFDLRYTTASTKYGEEIQLANVSDESFARYFISESRANLLNFVSVYDTEPNSFVNINTNRTMHSGTITNGQLSVLRAQADDFNRAMWDINESLKKVASKDKEEIGDDLVDQAGIDIYNSDSETAIKEAQKWWNELKAKINKRYEDINVGVDQLRTDCEEYMKAVDTFIYRMDTVHIPQYKKDMQEVFEAIQARESHPSNRGALFSAIRSVMPPGTKGQEFFKDYYAFCAAYEKFRKDVWTQCDNEVQWAGSVGATTRHGKKELGPDDIFPPDDPDQPVNPPGGDPSVSGNDDYWFGVEWKLGDHGWEKVK